jgi:Putative restriction endonuclease
VLPCTLFEVVSKKTVRADVGEKHALYERLRIPEYFLFDPEGRYLDRPLRGFRLRKGSYAELKPPADGSLISKQLGPRLLSEGELLRLVDLKTGQTVPTRLERAELAQAESARQKRRAEEARQRAESLAAEVERLRQLLKERRAGNGR